jgi:type IV fimbrial biogenesis protein FimT
MRHLRGHAGFTLIELMVTLVVLAIVVTIAVPSFARIIENNRMTAAVNALTDAIQLARSEAVKKRLSVVVCSRNAAGNGCAETTDWSAGWLVVRPTQQNFQSNEVIRLWDVPQGIRIHALFESLGFANTGITVRDKEAGNYLFHLINCSNTEIKNISISPTGSINKDPINFMNEEKIRIIQEQCQK